MGPTRSMTRTTTFGMKRESGGGKPAAQLLEHRDGNLKHGGRLFMAVMLRTLGYSEERALALIGPSAEKPARSAYFLNDMRGRDARTDKIGCRRVIRQGESGRVACPYVARADAPPVHDLDARVQFAQRACSAECGRDAWVKHPLDYVLFKSGRH